MILTADDGTIVMVGADLKKEASHLGVKVEQHDGLLVPGFVNTHCHLELSCMKGALKQHTGLTGFVKAFVSKRGQYSEQEKAEAIAAGEAEMIREGIVAVGDISNGNSTFKQKSLGNLYYHTFLEIFDLHPSRATETFERALALQQELVIQCPGAASAIVAHAPYTVSPALHQLIALHAIAGRSIGSIHSQESEAEEVLFQTGGGKLEEMYRTMGMDYSWFAPIGKSSLHGTLPFYAQAYKLLLVHNTFLSEGDAAFLKDLHHPQLALATCPQANRYIEGRLPHYPTWQMSGLPITVGTDSLASNNRLSILEEIKTIAQSFPQIGVETLFRWATLNGAVFLDIDSRYGSFEAGKRPGVVCVKGGALSGFAADASAKRLV